MRVLLLLTLLVLQASAQINIQSWAYQLQDINISQVSASTFDLIVMDYSSDGSESGEFSSTEIAQITNSGKLAISYISIGEAENYRYYWDENWDANSDGIPDNGSPEWLGNENPDWKGNYKVRFWDEQWQNIIFNYIDKIIAQEFNGIYCDIIDAYYYWAEEIGEEPKADSLMVEFVYNIHNHIAQQTADKFYIIPQNGEYIIEETNISEKLRTKYFNSIDAIGVEDIFFIGEQEENNPYLPDQDRIRILQDFNNAGKAVLSVEYITEQDLIDTYISSAQAEDFIPYATVRALDILHSPITSLKEEARSTSFSLSQNYPNPFNPTTTIKFGLPEAGLVDLRVYNILGQEVARLVNKELNAGYHEVSFGNNNLSTGMYIYRISVGDKFTSIKKMLLVK